MHVVSLLALGTLTFGVGAQPSAGPLLAHYDTPYYVIHTDLTGDAVREAALRLTKMAEEYHDRTRGFAGVIRERLPFYLVRDQATYHAAGGPVGSAGVFMGDRLMALAGEDWGDFSWKVVQHEGFHQFVHAVIGDSIPIWANEGLAEYFGEALFAGDMYFSGVIPPARLARVQAHLRDGSFKSIEEILLLSHYEWNAELSHANYDQAWSMVHFLAHADDGRYQPHFVAFMRAVSRGTAWPDAWVANFGQGQTAAFEAQWRAYWLSLPEDPSASLRAQATVATLTGFFARAASQKQYFESVEEFFAAGRGGTLEAHPEDWLPPALLEQALEQSADCGTWSLKGSRRRPDKLGLVMRDGTEFTGSFTVRQGRVGEIKTKASEPRKSKQRPRRKPE